MWTSYGLYKKRQEKMYSFRIAYSLETKSSSLYLGPSQMVAMTVKGIEED